MRAVQLLVCCLLLGTAASKCNADGSCASEKDWANLLQSGLVMHDAHSDEAADVVDEAEEWDEVREQDAEGDFDDEDRFLEGEEEEEIFDEDVGDETRGGPGGSGGSNSGSSGGSGSGGSSSSGGSSGESPAGAAAAGGSSSSSGQVTTTTTTCAAADESTRATTATTCAAKGTTTECSEMGCSCTWDETACQVGCALFPQGTADTQEERDTVKAACPAYCIYMQGGGDPGAYVMQAGNNVTQNPPQCLASVPLEIGGGNSGFDNKGNRLQRPEYKLSNWYNQDSKTWVACDSLKGKPDCFFGDAEQTLRVEWGDGTNPEITKAGVDIKINCEGGGDALVEWTTSTDYGSYPGNPSAKFWYNLQELTPVVTTKNGINIGTMTFTPTTDDASPYLRMEAERANGNVMIRVQLPAVTAAFEKCMDTKEAHGQCLTEFGTYAPALRGNPTLQYQCVTASTAEAAAEIDGCSTWLECLDADSKAVIEKMSKVMITTEPISFMQKGNARASQQQQGVWSEASGTCSDSEACIDPANFDIEAFDCDCFDWIATSTEAEVYNTWCGDAAVCCSWKNDVGKCPATSLMQGGKSRANDTLEQASKADTDSLDESLSGKRSCR